MSDVAMVLQCPDDLRAARVSASPLSLVSPSSNAANSDHHHHHPTIASSMLCDSPMSSSSVSTSPSTSTTSSSSVTPNNDGDDKPTETTPFIDPEDVIGRRVMFDLPPLMMDSGWGVPLDTNSASPETCSEVDFRNVTSPTITSLSGDGLVATGGLPFSSEHGRSEEFPTFLMSDGNCIDGSSSPPSIRLQILTPQLSDKDFAHPARLNGTISTSNRYKKQVYEDIDFIHWNWPLIRRCCQVTVISVMVGLLCIAIALIATAPKSCEPPRDWFQGGVFYEIIPTDFQDSDGDGIGDLSGIIQSLDYIVDLGVAAVRLNSLQDSGDDPVILGTSLNHSSISHNLGTMKEFEMLVHHLRTKNIRVILDLNAVFVTTSHPLVLEKDHLAFHPHNLQDIANDLNIAPEKMDQTLTNTLMLNLSHGYVQLEVQNAMQFWLAKGVDGFYMRYLEFLKLTPQILYNILEWRSIMDSVASSSTGRKILICSGKFIDLLEQHLNDQHKVEIFTGVFDLMEHELKFQPHVNDHLPQEIDRFTSRQFKKTPAPGMLWSIRSVNSSQLTTTLGDDQAFAAVLFSLMLPGTVNLFNRVEMSVEDYRQNNVSQSFSEQPLFPMMLSTKSFLNSSLSDGEFREVTIEKHLIEKNHNSFTQICRDVIFLRNSSTALFVSSMLHNGEHGNSKVPNYKVSYYSNDLLILERFYPRSKSFIILTNFGHKLEIVDLSSKFYQGKVIVTTAEKNGTLLFKNVPLKGGEVLIAEV